VTSVRESSKALAAFGVYRDMGPDRSLVKVSQECTKSVSLVRRWSAAHNWVTRATEHDIAIEAEVAATDRDARIADSQRRRAERLGIADNLRLVATQALDAIDVEDLAKRPLIMVRMLEYANRTERLDLGETTDRSEVTGPDGSPLLNNVVIYLPEKEEIPVPKQRGK
jgi:hypothetical protein